MLKTWILIRQILTIIPRPLSIYKLTDIRNIFTKKSKNFKRTAFEKNKRYHKLRCHQDLMRRAFYNIGFFLPSISMNSSIWHKTDQVEDLENNLAHMITLARVALERGDIDRAETILDLAVQTSEEHNLHNSIIFMYDILATIALGQGNVLKAERLLVHAIEKLIQIGFEESNHNIIDFKLRLARIYSAKGENALANIGFQNCMDQQRTKIVGGDYTDQTGLLYVNVMFWYGVHKHKDNQFEEAKSIITDAYEFSTKIKGITPKQEMILLYIMSDINDTLGNYDVALASLKDAIVLGHGFGSVDIPVCYLKLGSVYQKLNCIKDARSAFEEARKLAKTYGFYDVETEADMALYELMDIK